MDSNLALPLLTFAIVAMISGAVLQWRAIAKHGRDFPAWPTLNVKHWKPVWMMRDRFQDERGFNHFMWGAQLMQLGALSGVVVFVMELVCR